MEVDFHIIKRYLDGTGKKGDKEKILSWFSGNQEESDLRGEYYRYWTELPTDLSIEDYDEEKMLGNIYHKIKLEESKSLDKPATANRAVHKVISLLTKVAAVLFIPLTIFMLINRDRFVSTDYVAYSEIYAPVGTRTKFNLPDGSVGYLNGGSTVKFSNVFKGKSREVQLKGEAFFDVQSNPKKPFVVSGSNINVVAYGTSFNVEAYPEDNVNKVTLVKGKVEVLAKTESKLQSLGILAPGEMCVFNKEKSSHQFTQVDAAKIVSWKDGKLVFSNEPFDEVVKKLNRRYSVNITIKDEKLKTYTYLATFEDETLDEVLKLITISAPIEVKDLGRKIRPDGTSGERAIEFYSKIRK